MRSPAPRDFAAIAPVGPAVPRQPAPAGVPAAQARPGADLAAGSQSSYAVFMVDRSTRQTQIRIYDSEGRLIRMIPPKDVVDLAAQLDAYRRLR
jgi:hypothetical protein